MPKIETFVKDIKTEAAQVGTTLALGAMVTGTLLGVVELPTDASRRAVLTPQPVYAFAGAGANVDNQLRRERDDLGEHYVSYAEAERTASRSGKQ